MQIALLTALGVAGGCAETSSTGFSPPIAPAEPVARYGRQALRELETAIDLAGKLKYAEAEAMLTRLLRIFEAARDDRRAAEVMFWLGYCNEKQNRRRAAESFYDRVVKRYPKASAAREAIRRLTMLRSAPTSLGSLGEGG